MTSSLDACGIVVTLSSLGGLLVAVVGVVATWVTVQQLHLELVLSPDVIALSFLFSVLTGVVFGFLPARKAASLDPIQALRHE